MNINKALEILDKEVTSYAMSSDGIKYNSMQMLTALEVTRDFVRDYKNRPFVLDSAKSHTEKLNK